MSTAARLPRALAAGDVVVGLTTEHILKPGYSYGDELEYGLGRILDSLEAASRG